MNEIQKQQVTKLRADGFGYGEVANILGVSINSVKTYCKRHGLGGVAVEKDKQKPDKEEYRCQCCNLPIVQVFGRKEKRFCSNRCRNKWWNANLDKVNRMANYDFVCAYCKKPFTSYGNKGRKYCCHECYIADRFVGDK